MKWSILHSSIGKHTEIIHTDMDYMYVYLYMYKLYS